MMLRLATTVGLLSSLALPAMAQDRGGSVVGTGAVVRGLEAAAGEPEGFSVGLGLAGGVSPYVGGDDDIAVLPFLRYNTAALTIGLPEGVRVTLWSQDQTRLSAVLSPRLSEIDAADSLALAEMDRDVSIDGGLQADIGLGRGLSLSFRAVTEVTDEHGGQEVSAGIVQPVPLGRVPLILGAGVTWQSADLAAYVWGVAPGEARADRPAYDPGSVLIPYLSVGAFVPLAERLTLVGNLRADFLPGGVTDSPIIDEDISVGVLVGIAYRF
jgi:outer membrane protein